MPKGKDKHYYLGTLVIPDFAIYTLKTRLSCLLTYVYTIVISLGLILVACHLAT